MKYLLMYIKQTLRFVLKPMSFLPAVGMMCLIFYLSAQDGVTSSALSYRVGFTAVRTVNEVLDKEWTDKEMRQKTHQIQRYIRKTAHVTEYFLLAAFMVLPLYVYGLRGIRLSVFAVIFCVGFAALDEYHQLYVSGRGGTVRDVFIDSSGVLLGVAAAQALCYLGAHTLFKPLSNENTKK